MATVAAGAAAMCNYYAIEPRGFITTHSAHAAALMDAVAQWIDATCP